MKQKKSASLILALSVSLFVLAPAFGPLVQMTGSAALAQEAKKKKPTF